MDNILDLKRGRVFCDPSVDLASFPKERSLKLPSSRPLLTVRAPVDPLQGTLPVFQKSRIQSGRNAGPVGRSFGLLIGNGGVLSLDTPSMVLWLFCRFHSCIDLTWNWTSSDFPLFVEVQPDYNNHIWLLPVTKTGSISIQKEVLLIAIRILDLLSLRGNSKGTKPLAI